MYLLWARRRMLVRSWLLYGLTLGLALAVGVSVVAAHAELADSSPPDGALLDEPPEQVTLTFTQELEAGASSLVVLDQNGQQVDLGDGGVDLNDLDHLTMVVSLPASLADGVYTVQWTAVSAEDGDAEDGAISFTAGGVATGAAATAGEANSGPSRLLPLVALLAVALIVAGAIYVGRRRRVGEKV